MPETFGNRPEPKPPVSLGAYTYGDFRNVFAWNDKVGLKIGAYCSIAEGVKFLLGGEHNMDWVTTFPFMDFWPEAAAFEGHPKDRGDIVIGNDVWIGTDAMILSGTTIGDGAVIGARSLVRGYVPPYTVYAGTPARFIRNRFGLPMIAVRLMQIQWWNWPRARIVKALPLLLQPDIEKFIAAYDAGEI